jgi:hypothetical protein
MVELEIGEADPDRALFELLAEGVGITRNRK